MNYTANIEKLERHFLPTDFVVTDWLSIEPYLEIIQTKIF